ENTCERLIRGPLGGCGLAVAAEALHFVERIRVFLRRHRWWRRHAKLRGTVHHERPHLAPMRAERDAVETDWILAPVARIVVGVPILAEHRFRVLRTIRCAQVQDRVSSSLAEANAVEDRGRGIAQASHAVTQLSVERILLRRKHCDESVVRSICDSRFGRNLPADARQTGVAGVAAVGSNECVEYRDVHDRYCARRAAGPDLFAED